MSDRKKKLNKKELEKVSGGESTEDREYRINHSPLSSAEKQRLDASLTRHQEQREQWEEQRDARNQRLREEGI